MDSANDALHELSVAQLGAALRSGEVTAREIAEHALDRVDALDGLVHAFTSVTPERALADADRADRELRAGIDRGPLHGIPYALKDIYATAGIRTTCNSRAMLDYIPTEDAAVEEKLRRGGGVLLGKLNTHEYALGGPGNDLPYPAALNPWNREYFAGASSSGCGAAVAAGMVRVTLGSDTSGSIRSPAVHCGVVGLKPTYGLVSRRGVYPLSYSLDHCGPVTASVTDAALVMNVIAGHDPHDPGSARVPLPDYSEKVGRGIHGQRVAYARRFFCDLDGVSSEVVAAMDAAAELFCRLGASVDEVALPDYKLFDACGRVIMAAEGYAIHEQRLKAEPERYGRYTYQRLVAAAALSAADLIQAMRLRRQLTVQLHRDTLARYDVLITATAIVPAPRLDEFPEDWPPPSPVASVHTIPFSVTGNPAITVPIGFSRRGLPLGMQIVGKPFDEPTVLGTAAAFEAAAGVAGRHPPLWTVPAAARGEQETAVAGV